MAINDISLRLFKTSGKISSPQISPSLNGVRRATSNHWYGFTEFRRSRYSAGILYFPISELPSESALNSAVLYVRNSEFLCFSRVVNKQVLNIHKKESSTWKWILNMYKNMFKYMHMCLCVYMFKWWSFTCSSSWSCTCKCTWTVGLKYFVLAQSGHRKVGSCSKATFLPQLYVGCKIIFK
jgi:hypothetical protein